MQCVFCASRAFHEALHLATQPLERPFFGALLAQAVEHGRDYLCFPEEGQLKSGAAFRVDFITTREHGLVRLKCVTESMFDPEVGEWRAV